MLPLTRIAFRCVVALATLLACAEPAKAEFGDLLATLQLTGPEYESAYFGDGLDINDGVLAVTAPTAPGSMPNRYGVVVLYDTATLQESERLTQPSFSFSGARTIAVASSYALGGNSQVSGVAYRWIDLADDPIFLDQFRDPLLSPSEYFGSSVDATDDYFVIGAPGQAHGYREGRAFLFDAQTGRLINELDPLDALPGDSVGASVAIGQSKVLVGASHRDRFDLEERGSAYLFDIATQQQLIELTPPDEPSQVIPNQQEFGSSVALAGQYALVGAPGIRTDTGVGAVYVYDAESGEQLNTIRPRSEPFRGFGNEIAVADGLLIATNGWTQDAVAHVIDIETGLELLRIPAVDGEARDWLYPGIEVAIGDGIAVVSSPEVNGDRGIAYVYDVSNPQLPGDFNGDRRIDNGDLSLLLEHWGDPADSVGPEWDGWSPRGDRIDNDELSGLLYGWGAGTAGTSGVPEPHAVALLALAMAGGSARRLSRRG